MKLFGFSNPPFPNWWLLSCQAASTQLPSVTVTCGNLHLRNCHWPAHKMTRVCGWLHRVMWQFGLLRACLKDLKLANVSVGEA